MNKETIEKMAWLYEQGFKPDAGYCEAYKPTGYMLTFDPSFGLPYFTESRLWSLLPTRFIKDGNEYHLYITNDLELGYVSGKDCPIQLRSWLTLHASLLQLTIWAVKKGHLKVKEKQ
jgi:hypothetical protein